MNRAAGVLVIKGKRVQVGIPHRNRVLERIRAVEYRVPAQTKFPGLAEIPDDYPIYLVVNIRPFQSGEHRGYMLQFGNIGLGANSSALVAVELSEMAIGGPEFNAALQKIVFIIP